MSRVRRKLGEWIPLCAVCEKQVGFINGLPNSSKGMTTYRVQCHGSVEEFTVSQMAREMATDPTMVYPKKAFLDQCCPLCEKGYLDYRKPTWSKLDAGFFGVADPPKYHLKEEPCEVLLARKPHHIYIVTGTGPHVTLCKYMEKEPTDQMLFDSKGFRWTKTLEPYQLCDPCRTSMFSCRHIIETMDTLDVLQDGMDEETETLRPVSYKSP